MLIRLIKNDPPQNEMWEWTDHSWKKLPYPTPSITGLQAVALFEKNKIVLYDGNDNPKTWQFIINKWTSLNDSRPGTRMGHVMAYDKNRKKIVLFGGGKADTDIRYNDTWEWDGEKWEKK